LPVTALVPFKKRRGRLDLIAFPQGRWRGTFFRGERLGSVVRGHRWDLTIRGKRTRRYSLQASLPFEPCTVAVFGSEGRSRSTLDGRVHRASFRMRKGRVRVRGCG
jgi:hypothetical protein